LNLIKILIITQKIII